MIRYKFTSDFEVSLIFLNIKLMNNVRYFFIKANFSNFFYNGKLKMKAFISAFNYSFEFREKR